MQVLRHCYRQSRPFSTHRRSRSTRRGERVEVYKDSLEFGLRCPPRLEGRNRPTIEMANDWYFPMLNDSCRAAFYWEAMSGLVNGRRVLDLGSGCGLLSLMAAHAQAVRAPFQEVLLQDMSDERVDTIRVLHDSSSAVSLHAEDKADVIVCEAMGTLMLGEGMLSILADARRRLAQPDVEVVPAGGLQFATLVSSPSLAALMGWHEGPGFYGLDMSAANCLLDTGKVMSTKGRGIRLGLLPDLVQMSDTVCILSVDFASDTCRDIPVQKTFEVTVQCDGVVHAIVAFWEVSAGKDKRLRISTDYRDPSDATWGLARDLHWGQALQFTEDHSSRSAHEPVDKYSLPQPFHVRAGEKVLLTVLFSEPDRRMLQFSLQRLKS